MKKHHYQILAGITLLLAAAIAFFQLSRRNDDHQQQHIGRETISPESRWSSVPSTKNRPPQPSADHSHNQKTPALAPPAHSKEQCLEIIKDLSTTYDPAQLPKINDFLSHEDPEIRNSAVQGMIVLGDAKAAPFLRAAAKSAITPKEAVAMDEAADFLELPAATNFKLKKIK